MYESIAIVLLLWLNYQAYMMARHLETITRPQS